MHKRLKIDVIELMFFADEIEDRRFTPPLTFLTRCGDGDSKVWQAGIWGFAAFVAAFTPTLPYDPTWTFGRADLPYAMRDHLGHMKSFRDSQRAGSSLTLAQTQHALADVIDWLRLTDDRL